MSQRLLDTPIEFAKGIGPDRAKVLNEELGVFVFEDLLFHFPYRYLDKSNVVSINQLRESLAYQQVIGTITEVKEMGMGQSKRLVAVIEDVTGSAEVVWFNQRKVFQKLFKVGMVVKVFGKPKEYGRNVSFSHPEIEIYDAAKETNRSMGPSPFYHSTDKMKAFGIDSATLKKAISDILAKTHGKIDEFIPQKLLENYRLPNRYEAFKTIHEPLSEKKIERSRVRFAYEELLMLQLYVQRAKGERKQVLDAPKMTIVGECVNRFFSEVLPFELTNAQKKSIKEMRKDMGSGKPMNRLLQGDVGSGKTVTAFLTMLIAIDNGYQAALMAPTEILATQHFHSLSKWADELGIQMALLTGSTPKSRRKDIDYGLQSGNIRIIVGTHALLEEKVSIPNIGLAVVDEQHRFGVEQRAKLFRKGSIQPHILIMTATPIPRTIALTLYADLEVSVLNELPPGRQPIKTVHLHDSMRLRLYEKVKEELDSGRQAYFVYPIIDESETLDLQNLMQGYDVICEYFPRPTYQVSMLHGRMTAEEKESEMARFKDKKTDIMVSTTVIEVGVDVPNATVMVIESAERFGLSQLHQLRGRVGRGVHQSFCILVAPQEINHTTRQRIKAMVSSNDGFYIAEEDFKLRGPGDLMGTKQSGKLGLRVANLATDYKVLQQAKKDAEDFVKNDPGFEAPENQALGKELLRTENKKPAWLKVS